MKLSLSTAAVTGMAPDALARACRARGLDGVELVLGQGDDAKALVERLRAAEVPVTALRTERIESSAITALAALSGELGVPVSIPVGAVTSHSLGDLAGRFAEANGTLLVGFGTDLDQVVALTAALEELGDPPAVGLAWEIRPRGEDLEASGAVLLAAREHLRLVRLYGGGPEQQDQDGLGIGGLFVDLTLAGYGGTIVLTPSRPEELPRWDAWLASRKIGGCGSSYPAGEHEVDVRYVEPRDRLNTILGAFRALPPGATMRVTVDHDPSCMYYALESTEPEGTFAFRKLDDGPEVWHAEVTKVAAS